MQIPAQNKNVGCLVGASQVAIAVKNPPTNAGDIRDASSIPGSERSPGGRHGHPLQSSCLENPLDRGAWRATVLQSMGSQRVGPDGCDLACTHSACLVIDLSIYQGTGLLVMETKKSRDLLSEVGYQPREPGGAIPVQGQEETQSPTQGVGQSRLFLLLPFGSIPASVDWVMPTHIGEGNLSPWIQMSISSRNILPDIPRITFN